MRKLGVDAQAKWAMYLLSESQIAFLGVGTLVGYRHRWPFEKAFKNIIGVNPLFYRKRNSGNRDGEAASKFWNIGGFFGQCGLTICLTFANYLTSRWGGLSVSKDRRSWCLMRSTRNSQFKDLVRRLALANSKTCSLIRCIREWRFLYPYPFRILVNQTVDDGDWMLGFIGVQHKSHFAMGWDGLKVDR